MDLLEVSVSNVLAVVLAAVTALVLALRPRLLILPVVWIFAAWTWAKVILQLPVQVREWIEVSKQEKTASALARYADVAAALWSANTEFRPAAREIYGRVIAGCGISPPQADEESDPGIEADNFVAAQRNAVAGAVNATGGKPSKA